MAAYLISDVVGLDPELVARYRALAQDSIRRYDGQYLTSVGTAIELVEGRLAAEGRRRRVLMAVDLVSA